MNHPVSIQMAVPGLSTGNVVDPVCPRPPHRRRDGHARLPQQLRGPSLIAGLMEQGMSAGSAPAFMMVGAVSSILTMASVYSLMKKPVFVAYLGFSVSGSVSFGVTFATLI